MTGGPQELARRSLRVAQLGHVPADDPHVIADMQAEIDRLSASATEARAQAIEDAAKIAEQVADEMWKRATGDRAQLKADYQHDAGYRIARVLRALSTQPSAAEHSK